MKLSKICEIILLATGNLAGDVPKGSAVLTVVKLPGGKILNCSNIKEGREHKLLDELLFALKSESN